MKHAYVFKTFVSGVQLFFLSPSIRTHLNASERIRTGPKTSENFQKLPKTSENFREIRKFREKNVKKLLLKQNATFRRNKPIVPGFLRIRFRFERIPGRLASFLQKRHFVFLYVFIAFFRFDRFDIHFDSIDTMSEDRGGPPWLASSGRHGRWRR